MANKQIKNLDEVTEPTTSDLLLIQSASTDVTNKVTVGNLLPSGSVTSDKLNTTVAFRATPTGTQTLTDVTYNKAQFGTVDFDLGGNYDNANYRFVAPYDGVYQFNANAMIAGLGDTELLILTFYIDGVEASRSYRGFGNATETGATIAMLRQLTASQYVEFYIYIDGGGTETVANASGVRSSFSGFLVGLI